MKSISFSEMNALMRQDNIKIIDLRTPEELQKTGMINKHVQVKNFYDKDFKKFVEALDKSKQYIVYCKSGGRSALALKIFQQAGLKVFDFRPGMSGWLKSGRSIVR